MRQLQKMQMGMALCALLLCFSPAATWLTESKAATVRIAPVVPTLTSHLHTDVRGDGSMIWFQSVFGQSERPIASVSRVDRQIFQSLINSVASARPVQPSVRSFPYLCIVYRTSGQVDRTFRMAKDGVLKDVETGQWFVPGASFRQFVIQHVVKPRHETRFDFRR